MTNDTMSIIGVIVASISILGLRELLGILRRPRIKLDFEEYFGKKPYLPQFADTNTVPLTLVKYVRLIAENKGWRAAENCEAKFEVYVNGELDPLSTVLHWSRRDPLLFKDPMDREEYFKPITINKKAKEALDVLKLPKKSEKIRSMSPREHWFSSHKKYLLKVTVFSSNANPSEKKINLYWDGTWDNFDKSIS